MYKQVILASQSPRREQLLKNIIPIFSIMPAKCDETLNSSLELTEAVKELSIRKVNAINASKDSLIIGADTIVALDGHVFTKPNSRMHAIDTLRSLSSQTHQVITGISLKLNDSIVSDIAITNITFKELSTKEIEEYVDTAKPFDKAGAYGIQDKQMNFIESIDGDYFNVVGLPLALLTNLLTKIS